MDKKQVEDWLKRNKVLLIIFLVALALRVGLNVARQELFFHTPFLPTISENNKLVADLLNKDERTSGGGDSLFYIYAAKGFLEGNGIISMEKSIVNMVSFGGYINPKEINESSKAHKTIPPLYPLFLALCFFIGGYNFLSFFIPQLILSSLTCLIIYFIAEEFFNQRIAFFAGLLVAFYPEIIFWSSFARTETLFIFLLTFAFLLFIKGNARKKVSLVYSGAVFFGLACLTRVTLTPFMPFILIWLFNSYSENKKSSFMITLQTGLIIFLVLLPWGLRNYIAFGQFDILSDEAGILIGSFENHEQYANGVVIDKEYQNYEPLVLKILIFMKDNFKVYMMSFWRRFLLFWCPFTYVMKPLAKLFKGLTWLIIFPAAFYGMFIVLTNRIKHAKLILIFVFYHSLLHAGSFVDLGLVYRYPILPFLCIFSSLTLCNMYEFFKKSF